MPVGIPKNRDETRGSKEEPDFHQGEKHTGITIFDKSEPRSVYNLVSKEVQASIDKVNPRFWEYSFKALEKNARPDATLSQLRVAFWHQYNETQDKFRPKISLTRVMYGICSKQHFYNILQDQIKVAYLLYPTTDYISGMQEMHDLAMREMRKILVMPNKGAKGANLPIIKEKIKLFALLENRLRGSVPVRVQRDERHVHAHIQVNETHQEAPKSLEAIDTEIRRIERTVRTASEKKPEIILEANPGLKTKQQLED